MQLYSNFLLTVVLLNNFPYINPILRVIMLTGTYYFLNSILVVEAKYSPLKVAIDKIIRSIVTCNYHKLTVAELSWLTYHGFVMLATIVVFCSNLHYGFYMGYNIFLEGCSWFLINVLEIKIFYLTKYIHIYYSLELEMIFSAVLAGLT